MHKFRDISKIALGLMVVVLLLQFYVLWILRKKAMDPVLAEMDLDQDGVVTKRELKYYLEHSQDSPVVKQSKILKGIGSGVLRGALTGIIFQDVEGGLVLALMLAVINPIMGVLELEMNKVRN
jgi:hypothetical protein